MEAESPIDYSALKHSGSLIARAHRYFTETIEDWLGETGSSEFGLKASALVDVLTRGIQLVTINLEAYENPQEIFETLNARGTPLTAADLIRNFVFQKLENEGVDTKQAYAEHWPFDTPFWDVEVGSGRHAVSRSSLFFNQWLVSRVGEEVSPKATFNRFKHYVELVAGEKMSDLLPLIEQQANQYEAWTLAAEDKDRQLTRVEMSVYRMKAIDVELLKPILIWLHAPGSNAPQAAIDQVIGHLESWIVRRQLLRLPGPDLGRIVADIVRLYSSSAPEELPTLVANHLMNLNVAGTYWPGDEEVRITLQTEPVFRRYKRARLRMVLEAIENQLRLRTNQPQVPRRGYPIEHILPQKWTTYWPVEGLEAELERAAYIHRLGNLTLLTGSLNAKVSNGPWQKKMAALQQHDTLLLNSRLLAATSESDWEEDAIDRRSDEMIDLILAEWPVPGGHKGEIVDLESRAVAWVQLKDLVDVGLIDPGIKLVARPSRWAGTEATVTAAGLLTLDGQVFDSPSGAASYLEKRASNGWNFWGLPDGRRLADLRTVYKSSGSRSHDPGWVAHLHIVLEAMPEGTWTMTDDLSESLGVGRTAVAEHMVNCSQCVKRPVSDSGEGRDLLRHLDADELSALGLDRSAGDN